MTREMGKVLEESRGDVQEAIDMAFFAAGLGRRPFGETIPSELPDKACFTWREPIGVAGVVTPWNFPVAVPAGSCSPPWWQATRSSSSRPRTPRSAGCDWPRRWSTRGCRRAF